MVPIKLWTAGDGVSPRPRDAVLDPLARLSGRSAAAGWVAVVDAASTVAGWDRDRWAALRLAVDPDRIDDPAPTLAALWDLVTELNERRRL